MSGTARQEKEIEIRQLSTLREFSEAVRLQKEIWGFQDLELLPVRLFVVASKIGGQALGAFENREMVAFSLCIPGLKPGGTNYLHSHMLGVMPKYRNTGLGRRLKWKQREFAIDSGVKLIEWTFDPLELKNAFFNIERLGAVMRRYVHNQYGRTTSTLHGGLPTDRLIAEWWICSERVAKAREGSPPPRAHIEARISVPADIGTMKQHDPDQAQAIQTRIGEDFDTHFRAGLAVIGFERSATASAYLLGRWESE